MIFLIDTVYSTRLARMELYLCIDAFEDISSLEEISDISITPPTVVNVVVFLICSSELACYE